MNKKLLISASVLTVVGVVIMALALASCGFNFKKIGPGEYETYTHEVSGDFSKISVVSDVADITFIPSENDTVRVVCENDSKNSPHAVSINNGVLEISNATGEEKWYESIFSFTSPKIKAYVPAGKYTSLKVDNDTGSLTLPKEFSFESIDVSVSTGNVHISASSTVSTKVKASTGHVTVDSSSVGALTVSVSTGNVKVSGCEAKSIAIETTTGKVECSGLTIAEGFSVNVDTGKSTLSDLSCKSFTSRGDTGKINMTRFVATDTINIERSTGDVTFTESDAAEITVETSTGDVSITLLTEKVFIVRSDTGKIRVPETTSGGKCKITTDTGDITASICVFS